MSWKRYPPALSKRSKLLRKIYNGFNFLRIYMYKKMKETVKKYLILLILIILTNHLVPAIEKPRIKYGLFSYGYFDLKEESYRSLYPSSFKDRLFFIFEEKLGDHYTFEHYVDLYFTNNNKYTDNIESLRSFQLDNTIVLTFNVNKFNQFRIYERPSFYYQNGERYIKQINKLQYRFGTKYFVFRCYYSNYINYKFDTPLYHYAYAGLYWSLPKAEHLKFKTSVCATLQHNVKDGSERLSPLRSLRINFEMAVDFNKIDLDELFDRNKSDEVYQELYNNDNY
jgi:hypothetical protein